MCVPPGDYGQRKMSGVMKRRSVPMDGAVIELALGMNAGRRLEDR